MFEVPDGFVALQLLVGERHRLMEAGVTIYTLTRPSGEPLPWTGVSSIPAWASTVLRVTEANRLPSETTLTGWESHDALVLGVRDVDFARALLSIEEFGDLVKVCAFVRAHLRASEQAERSTGGRHRKREGGRRGVR